MQPKRHTQIVDADQVIREYYENQPPSEGEAFLESLESIPTPAQRAGKIHGSHDSAALVSAGDPDAVIPGSDDESETAVGSNPTPDQDVVEEIGEAVGVTYQDNEPLNFEDKITARDESRWELDPASSEDYQERRR